MLAGSETSLPETRHGPEPPRFLGWLIPLVFIPFLVLASPLHSVFNEWGGVMQWFAGQDILGGVGYRGWTAHFWPPLFSILMGLGGLLAPGFLVGKVISGCASVLLLHLAYRLAWFLSQRVSLALWTQVFLVVNPLYFRESLIAHNHMLDAFFFVTGLYLFLVARRNPAASRALIAGLVCGLAALTRTTSIVLVLLAVLSFLKMDRRPATRLALGYLGGFLVVTLPWLAMNAAYNGSPFANWQYLNVYTGVLDPDPGTNLALWRANADASIQSVPDLFLAHPVEYVRNVVQNLVIGMEKTVRQQGSLAAFVLPGILDVLVGAGLGAWGIVLAAFALYLAMVSQAHVQSWYLLPWIVPMTVFGVRLIVRYGEKAGAKWRRWRRLRLSHLGLALLALYGARSTNWDLQRMAREDDRYRPMAESHQVAQALKGHDPLIQTKIIMAIDPGRAYTVGGKYLMTPLEYDGPVTGLVAYEGLDDRIRNYTPRFPADLDDFHADYLVFTRTEPNAPSWSLKEPRGFDFLLDPSSEDVPSSFSVVYRSPNVVAYQVLR